MHHQSAAAVGLRVVVGGVVRDVAMDHPVAGLECFPDDVVTLAGADVDRVGPEAGGRRQGFAVACNDLEWRSEEHTSELQSLMRISYAVFCLKKKNIINRQTNK